MTTRATRYTRSPDVIATDIGDELILLDPTKGEMYGLNDTARRVWLCLASTSAEDVAEMLCAMFEVPAERASSDARSLLDSFVASGLVREDPAS